MLTKKFKVGMTCFVAVMLFITITFLSSKNAVNAFQLHQEKTTEDTVFLHQNMQPNTLNEEIITFGPQEELLDTKVEDEMSDDLYWLSKIVYAEARGEDDKGQRLVAEVVINRVNHPSFPNTIKEVIFQGNGMQFQPVMDGSIDLEPDERAIENARIVLENGNTLTDSDVLFFNATSLGKKEPGTKWWKGVYTAFVHGGHVFAERRIEG